MSGWSSGPGLKQIKLAPVAAALSTIGVRPALIMTGQQRIQAAEFGLADYPAVHVGCPGQHDPDAHARQLAGALIDQLRDPPDLLVVQDNTSSAKGRNRRKHAWHSACPCRGRAAHVRRAAAVA